MKIGILGGTFDPPHIGHLNISLEAIKRFHLNKVIWLITKKNPLKKNNSSNDILNRIKLCNDFIKKNKINKINENDDLVFRPSKKCEFNPCQNDGSCYLLEPQRFTCVCKDFYYGVYCEYSNLVHNIYLLKTFYLIN